MAGDTNWASVSLLLHCDGANGSTTFTDSSPTPKTVTRTNAVISTAQSKFGGSSAYFDGTGDYLSSASNTAFDFPGDFTIDFQVRIPSLAGDKYVINRKLLTGAPVSGDWGININGTTGQVGLYTTVANNFTFASGNLAIDTWYHIAIVRSGTSVFAFKDGVKSTNSFTISTNFTTARTLEIGRWDTVPNVMTGYLDEIRITKGVARWTADFTAPTAAHVNGMGQVAGVVRDASGTPCARTVRAYRRDTGAFAGSAVSDSGTGVYSIDCPTLDEVSVVALDDAVSGTYYNDQVVRVIPA